MSEVLHEPEPETWQTDALGLLEADPVRPPSEGLARRTRDVAKALARSAEPAGTLPVGARVGPYTLGEVLGRGGQATVYRATDDEGRSFAVKVPRPELVSRLAREAQILFHLDHPRIVRIERADMKADPPFIACRLLEGGTLAERLRKGPLSPPDVACLADQILEALIHGHEKGVVHRDLKPSNVLFDRQHDAQVADFGVGSLRLVEEHGLGQTLVSVDVTRGAGTPLYMAPEQEQVALRVDGKVDGRADLYALGKLLYEALTGRPPRTIRPASQVVLGLDPRWDAFLFRLVEDRPQDRYPDAAVARAALRLLLRPVSRSPGSEDVLKLLPGKVLRDEPSVQQVKVGWASLDEKAAATHPALERDDGPPHPPAELAALAPPSGGALASSLERPPRPYEDRLHAIRDALDGIQSAARAASAALITNDGQLVAEVGAGPADRRTFARGVAALCLSSTDVARTCDGTPEYPLLFLESRATVLTVARVTHELRVALLGASPPPREPLRDGLQALARAVHPERTIPRGLAFVRRTPEEQPPFSPAPARSFVARALPIVAVGSVGLCAGMAIVRAGDVAVIVLVGLFLGLLLGLGLARTLWSRLPSSWRG